MKNLSSLLLVLSVLFIYTLGCSSFSGSSNSGPTPATGIAECDQLFAKIEEKVSDKNKETTFIERAAYNLIKDQIAKGIRDGMANSNARDKKDIAAKCSEAMEKIDESDDNSNHSSNSNTSNNSSKR